MDEDPHYVEGFNANKGCKNPYTRDKTNDLRIARLAVKETLTKEEEKELGEMNDKRCNSPHAQWELGYYNKHKDVPDEY